MTDRNRTFDLLRIIAALLVMAGHSFELLNTRFGSGASDPLVATTGITTLGGCGVLMFFAISGYWISKSAEESDRWLSFAWRRALRILPALWVALALSVFVLGPLFTKFPLTHYFMHPDTKGYLHGFFFLFKDGLPEVFTNNPLTSTVNGSLWTLRMEVKCYLLLSLILFLPKSVRRATVAVLFAIALYMALRHVFRRPFRVPIFNEASAVTVYAVLAFFIGALIQQFRMEKWCIAWPWLLVTIIILGFGWLRLGHLPTSLAFSIALTFLTLGVGFFVNSLAINRLLRADVSYGLYLYAFPIQQALIASFQSIDPLSLFAATLFFALIMATLSWYVVEKPMIDERDWLAEKLRFKRSNPSSMVQN